VTAAASFGASVADTAAAAQLVVQPRIGFSDAAPVGRRAMPVKADPAAGPAMTSARLPHAPGAVARKFDH
jgi:hypothetical protein